MEDILKKVILMHLIGDSLDSIFGSKFWIAFLSESSAR